MYTCIFANIYSSIHKSFGSDVFGVATLLLARSGVNASTTRGAVGMLKIPSVKKHKAFNMWFLHSCFSSRIERHTKTPVVPFS